MASHETAPWSLHIATIFPEFFESPLATSIVRRAIDAGLLDVAIHDIRDHAEGRHRQVDDAPYGGGAGMVMKVDVVHRAIEAVRRPDSHVLLTSASPS